MIASMDMRILERVKILEPGMKTVYISAVLLTQGHGLKEIDAYSVETTALSADLVNQAHPQGKVWQHVCRILWFDPDGYTNARAILIFAMTANVHSYINLSYAPF